MGSRSKSNQLLPPTPPPPLLKFLLLLKPFRQQKISKNEVNDITLNHNYGFDANDFGEAPPSYVDATGTNKK